MSEMRTMASSTATATKPGTGEVEGEGKKSKKKLMIIVIAVVVLGGGAAWYFLMGPGHHASGKKAVKPPPVAGTVLPIDPISVNLADGHYLKIGIALQEIAGAKEVTDGSKALDATISTYSNQTMATLSDPAKRDEVKKQLVEKISKAYDEQVYDIYFTTYVMQ